ncbi:hypothetical protein GQ53DRAFT_648827 [Thozetella sp. PMI_491]|nr:hypothetical protein GQ53DRAFT_648827 [Thozetella sp. PMI_491]
MAYLAQLAAQTDELIAAVVPASEPQRRNALRETTLRALRQHPFGRTNQFEVQEVLEGLEERFRVTGRDALGSALKKRLDALEPYMTEWTPEILQLLLELSDRPALKSQITDLDLLLKPEEEPVPPLTWRDIAVEDGWDDDRALWRTIDYTNSSEDEIYEDTRSESSVQSDGSVLSSAEKYSRAAKDYIIRPEDKTSLGPVKESQTWRDAASKDPDGRSRKTPLSVYQMLREVLFMLGGLETTLFDAKCNPVLDYQLTDMSWDTHRAFISSLAECGRSLRPLRKFVASRHQIPLLQVFQDSVQKALRSLDEQLATMQGRFMEIGQDVVVSLAGVMAELGPYLTPLYALANILRRLETEPHAHAFRYLELLFDAAEMAQLEGNDATYELLGSAFFDCFQVYLRPIRLWMDEGQLVSGDRSFFLSESPSRVPLPRIWDGQFKLLRTSDGALHTPRFLRPAIQRIFTTGKSIVMLKHLGRFEANKEQWMTREPRMDFSEASAHCRDLAPFPEVFNASFNVWIQSKHHTASATLRTILFEDCGLTSGLDALQRVYLMSDGAMSDAFALGVFRHLDGLSASWKDRFILTELAQEAFSSLVDAYRLSACVDSKDIVHSAIASRVSVRVSLPSVRLSYRLNWPVQVIVPDEAVQGYHTVFVLLLQIRRATYMLQKNRFTGTSPDSPDSGQQSAYCLLRARLLWFCNSIMTYLTSLVLAPNTGHLREGLHRAVDVDEMISVHKRFIDTITNEACLGPKLQPIRECILDILDLTIRLEDAQQAAMARLADEEQEISRLSIMASPVKTPARKGKGVYVSSREDEDGSQEDGIEGVLFRSTNDSDKSYTQTLKEVRADFERHLRFVAGGLRGVARASRDEAATKWDLLAEMLEVGIGDQR